ncbi:MAG TPA: HEPN domain-containing protein [Stellaceae bacterium]|nr:HEPN domain-containing protein [Stellaceae bacterium]
MTPETGRYLDKARECLARARIILDAGVGEDAGRNAYLAAFHAAQAFLLARTEKVARTHHGVHVQFSRPAAGDPRIEPDLQRFLSQAYNLKAVADYELGPGAGVPLERAAAAIEAARRFIDRIAALVG